VLVVLAMLLAVSVVLLSVLVVLVVVLAMLLGGRGPAGSLRARGGSSALGLSTDVGAGLAWSCSFVNGGLLFVQEAEETSGGNSGGLSARRVLNGRRCCRRFRGNTGGIDLLGIFAVFVVVFTVLSVLSVLVVVVVLAVTVVLVVVL
jgi:hypothetical protein